MSEFFNLVMQKIPVDPIQFIYGAVAICGGVARYLNGVAADGKPFQFGIFVASSFVAGFSGWMFATLGLSLSFPDGIVFMMAGTGGFFGDQTMKLILDVLTKRIEK